MILDLLVIVPHPDDEVFSAGGILSKMAAFDKSTGVLTLTRGAAGKTLGLCTLEELPMVREKELKASLDILGVKEQRLLDYPDGKLKDIDPQGPVADIRNALNELKPKVIITFAPNGSNGHMDHVMTHHFVMKALEDSHQPEKIYYYATETPYAGIVKPNFLHPDEVRRLHLPPTHYLDMRDYLENKIRAMGHYETQAWSVLMFMRKLPRKLIYESFYLARPGYPDQGPMTVQWL
ncbi:MAG: PIG-L deacetylase family protein [Deinococcales bacterium]